MRQLKQLKNQVGPFRELSTHCKDLLELTAMTEESDAASMKHLEEEETALDKKIAALEFQKLLSLPEDPSSAILSINAAICRHSPFTSSGAT